MRGLPRRCGRRDCHAALASRRAPWSEFAHMRMRSAGTGRTDCWSACTDCWGKCDFTTRRPEQRAGGLLSLSSLSLLVPGSWVGARRRLCPIPNPHPTWFSGLNLLRCERDVGAAVQGPPPPIVRMHANLPKEKNFYTFLYIFIKKEDHYENSAWQRRSANKERLMGDHARHKTTII